MPGSGVDILRQFVDFRQYLFPELMERGGVQPYSLYLHGTEHFGEGNFDIRQNAVHSLGVQLFPQGPVQQEQRLPQAFRAVGCAVFRAQPFHAVVVGIHVQQVSCEGGVEYHVSQLHAVPHAVGIQRLGVVGALFAVGAQEFHYVRFLALSVEENVYLTIAQRHVVGCQVEFRDICRG